MIDAGDGEYGFRFPGEGECSFREVLGDRKSLGGKKRTLTYGEHNINGFSCQNWKEFIAAILVTYERECTQRRVAAKVRRLVNAGTESAFDLTSYWYNNNTEFRGFLREAPRAFQAADSTRFSGDTLLAAIGDGALSYGIAEFEFDLINKDYLVRMGLDGPKGWEEYSGLMQPEIGARLLTKGSAPVVLTSGLTDSLTIVVPASIPEPLYPEAGGGAHKEPYAVRALGLVLQSAPVSATNPANLAGTHFEWSDDAWLQEFDLVSNGVVQLSPVSSVGEQLKAIGIDISEFPKPLMEYLMREPRESDKKTRNNNDAREPGHLIGETLKGDPGDPVVPTEGPNLEREAPSEFVIID